MHVIIYLSKECHCKSKGLNFIIGMDGELLKSMIKVIWFPALKVEKGEVFRGISDVFHLTSMLCHMQRKRSSIKQNINLKLQWASREYMHSNNSLSCRWVRAKNTLVYNTLEVKIVFTLLQYLEMILERHQQR